VNRPVFVLFLFLSSFVFGQNGDYLENIIKLENLISNEQFLDTILKIDKDKALLNTKKYLLLTEKGEKIALEINNKILLAKIYEAKSIAYHFSSKTVLEFEYNLKAIKIYEELSDVESLAAAYTNLGWEIKNRDLQKAIFYMKKGISILEKNKPTSYNLEKAYNNYGVLKQKENQLDSAIFYHNKALKRSLAINDSIAIPFAKTHIAEVYMKKKEFLKAEKLFIEALKIRQNRNDTYGVTDSYLYLGDLFFAKKEYKIAINYFSKAEKLSIKNSYYPLKKYAAEYLYKSHELNADAKKALDYYKIFIELKDSILNKETNSKIAELEIKFNSTEKDKEIAEKELEIKNRNLYAILLASALLISGVIFFGIYKKNQFKRKQLQKEIDLKDALATIKMQNRLQEQRLKISRDLHDNIGSQLTFIISSIDNLKFISKDANTKLKDKLASISSFTSGTIYELRDTIWAMNKNTISVEDLHSRILSFIEKAKIAVPELEFEILYTVDKNTSFSSLVGMNLFRVIQEAINNTIKYADASKVKIHLKKDFQNFVISIIDNGKGFNINKVDLGNGLSNMEKRMSEIDAKVSINSKEKIGTEIKLEIPFENTSNDV
jgi:signal transduction histidine kinase